MSGLKLSNSKRNQKESEWLRNTPLLPIGAGETGMTNLEMRAKVASAILTATGDVFTMMLGMQPQAGEVVHTTGAPSPSEGVVSLIGLAGPWQGTGCISCNAETACKLAGALMMCEYPAVTEDVLDAVAELTNIIVGNVKTIVETDDGMIGLSIPTVIFGKNFSTKSGGHSYWTGIPFNIDGGALTVQMCLIKTQEGRVPGRLGFTNPQMAVGDRFEA